jgi:NAD(P)-dependent dehydrogenase (short-subunit alcohol dehydrogenase family)
MNVYDLKDRVAIVTGGAQGIGLAVATRIIASGGKVSIWDRDAELLNKTVAGLNEPARVQGLTVDIADLAAVEAGTKQALAHFGKLDILINNAAVVGPNANTWEYPPEAFRDVINVGLIGTFYCCRAVLPHMIAAMAHRQSELGRRQGGQPESAGLQLDEGRGDRLHQIARQGACELQYRRQLRDAGGGEDDACLEPGAGFSGHDRLENSARPHARARRSRRDDLLARERGKLVHHRRRVRSLRRPRDVLGQ